MMILGRNIIFMAAEMVGFFSMVLLTEMELFRSLRRWWAQYSLRSFVPEALTKEIDEDVAAEVLKVNMILQSIASTINAPGSYSLVDSAEECPSPGQNLQLQSNDSDPTTASGGGGGEIELQSMEVKATTMKTTVSASLNSRNVDIENYSLVMAGLSKIYPPTILSGQPKQALRDLTLALKQGERFGLLGVNGAGKSTTMAILTGDTEATMGVAYVAGRALSDPETRLKIGFCPQTDPVSSSRASKLLY